MKEAVAISVDAAAPTRAPRAEARVTFWLMRSAALAPIVLCVPVLLWLNRSQWFYFDEWAFIDGVRSEWADGRYVHALFAPHNEHWSTVPIVVYSILFKLFGLRTYLPYLAVLVLLNLMVALLLRVLLVRNGVNGTVATLAGMLIMLFGAGSENLVWAFQIGFVASVAFGLLQLVLVDHDGAVDRRDYFGLAAGAAALMSSGIAISMTVVVGLALVIRRRWRAALLATVPLAITFLIWHRLIGYQGRGGPRPTSDQLAQLPQYVWRGFAATVEGTVQLQGVAAVILVAMLVFLGTLNAKRARELAVPLAMAAGGVALFILTGFGRIGFGIDQAASPRYVYIAAVLLLPLALVGLSQLRRGAWPVIVVGVLLWSVVGNALALGRVASTFTARNQAVRRTLLAAAEVPNARRLDPNVRPDPTWAPDLRLGTLLSLKESRLLPGTDGVSDGDRLVALGNLTVSTAPADGSVIPVRLLATARVRLEPTDQCVTVIPEGEAPQVKIGLDRDAELEINPAAQGNVQVFLQTTDGRATAPTPRTLPVNAGVGTAIHFLTTATDAIVTLPSGGGVLCGLASA